MNPARAEPPRGPLVRREIAIPAPPLRRLPARAEPAADAQASFGNAALARSLTPGRAADASTPQAAVSGAPQVPSGPALATVPEGNAEGTNVAAAAEATGQAPSAPAARAPAAAAVGAEDGSAATEAEPETQSLSAFKVELPPQLGAPASLPSFEAPSWDARSLRPSPAANRERGKAQDLGAAIGRAQTRYGNALTLARQRHDSVAQHAQNVQQALVSACQQVVGALPLQVERIDAALDAPLQQNLDVIDATAQEADALVVAAHRRARRMLGAAVEHGRGAVAGNLITSELQILAIVQGLSTKYAKTLNDTAIECQETAELAQIALDDWMSGASDAYPAGVGGIAEAEHETKRQAVPDRASLLSGQMSERSVAAAGSFRDQIAPVSASIGAAVEPALRQRVAEIGEKGVKAVNDAYSQASDTLREQARQARASVESMRVDARASVFARRRAARARIEAIGTRTAKDAQRETDAAQHSLGTSLLPTLSLYGKSMERVQAGLADASRRGAEALDRASGAATRGVDATTARGAAAQSQRLESTRADVEASLLRRTRDAPAEAGLESEAAETEMGATTQDQLPAFTETARSQTEGFAQMGAGIVAATAYWSEPLGQTFSDYIAEVRNDLDRRHDEEVDGNPAFVTQIEEAKQPYIEWATSLQDPESTLASDIEAAWAAALTDLRNRARNAGNALSSGIIDVVDEAALSSALRNITAAQGTAIRAIYLDIRHRTLDEALQFRVMTNDLDSDEYKLALTYLSGDARKGNRLELEASRGWINDDEARIEEVMRSLSSDQLEALHATEGWAQTAENVRGVLGGTDLAVFDALDAGKPARADAIQWRERMDKARARGELDSLNDIAAGYSGAATYQGNAEERRRMVQEEFAQLLRESGAAERGEVSAAALAEGADPANAVVEYGARTTDVLRSDWLWGPEIVREGLTGPNQELFSDIVRHGEESVQARQSRLAVEFAREGGPDLLRLDRALVDPRLNPNFYPGGVIPEGRLREARADREAVSSGFARRFGGTEAAEHPDAQAYLSSRIDRAFGSDRYGASIASLLVYEEVPSPETASHMMRYAMTHKAGTNEALLDRVVGRMNRDEIAAMTRHYNRFGTDLNADLGIYGRGLFGELSGDERLSMEVKMLGVPRNDKERAEVAAFTAQQQRDETGGLGSWLTSGDFQDLALTYEADRLAAVSGITVGRDRNGAPVFSGGANFQNGEYVGGNRAEFEASTAGAVEAAHAYAARVDTYANFAANSIMVIGAVVATVLTAGGAGPLLLAAIAAGTGLAGMAARAMISGGRYGWEQALTDLGATLVQALTAGLGATLGLASRGGSAAVGTGLRAGLTGRIPQELLKANMGRLTGTALGDTLLIGATTNALNTAGNSALSEKTWEKGIGHGVGELFGDSLGGAFTGILGAGIGHGLNAIQPGRIPGLTRLIGAADPKASIGEMLGHAGPLTRGLGQGGIAAISGFGSRYAELALQAGRGRYSGDTGEMALESGQAAALAGVQGLGEGVGESLMQRRMDRAGQRAARAGAAGAPGHEVLPALPHGGGVATPDIVAAPVIEAPSIVRPTHVGPETIVHPGAAPEVPPAKTAPPFEPETGDTAPPPRGPHEGDSGVGGAGPPRRPLEDERLFPHLSDAEIDAAFAGAESGALVRVGADQPGADTRALAHPDAALADLPQRQRAGALLDQAGSLAAQADGLLRRSIAVEARAAAALEHNPRRAQALRDEATHLLDQAAALERQAVALRHEAAEFASGRRSATLDLPGPEDLEAHFDSLRADAPGLVRVPLSDLERHPELIPRLMRPLLQGEGGRIVFRVESERSRSLVSVDADGNVRVAGGAAVHLNFGSFERAVEFVLQSSQGKARIIAFEVDEAWVRAARSAAIPEHETAALAGRQPRVVDVRFAHDQLEIPAVLIPELNRFIVPGSGVVHEIPAGPPRGGPDEGGGRLASLHPSDEAADAMRQALLRHVPAEQHGAMADVPIVVLPPERYRALTRSDSGPVVTVMRNGRPEVVVREGTPISRLADEGPHLSQAHEAPTRERVARLDEARLRRWDSLDLDEQLDLYRNKIELEIDAHERILGSLDREAMHAGADPAQLGAERARAEGTLRNLRARLGEVDTLGPTQRAAIESSAQARPQYLDQPARLFSKDSPPHADVAAHPQNPDLPATPAVKPPDVAELTLLRAEEHALQASVHEVGARHRDADRIVRDAQEGVRRGTDELEPLETRRRQHDEELRQLRARHDELREARADIKLPGDRGFDETERRQFSALDAGERAARRGEAARLEGELRALRGRDDELVNLQRGLEARIGELSRRVADGREQVAQFEPLVHRTRDQLTAMNTRLEEIAARRGSVSGGWQAEYERIGERAPCFVAGTQVHTPAGLRGIETLVNGDLVFAFDTKRGLCTVRSVLRLEQGHTQRLLDIVVAGERLSSTPQHRFWSPARRQWVQARELAAGMRLLDRQSRECTLESTQERQAHAPTFNLLVDGEHNYFVGQAGVLVHNGKDPDELTESIFRDEWFTPPTPFIVRYYVIVHADDPDTIIYVGSTERALADRLRGHVRDRVYSRGPKAGTAWIDEAGGRVLIRPGANATEVRSGPFIIRELSSRECHSHFERFVWELYHIESIRQAWEATMQNDFGTPPVGQRKFEEFREYYLARLCAA